MSELSNIKRLLINMHCSRCRSEYDENSIKIMRSEKGLLVFQVKCEKCKRCFGMALLGMDSNELEKALDMDEKKPEINAEPINYDDVLDAHHFFQNLDENWSKYIN